MFEIPFWMIFKVTIPQISNEERIVVEKKRKSYTAVQAAFRQRFNQVPSCKKTIQQNVTKYSYME